MIQLKSCRIFYFLNFCIFTTFVFVLILDLLSLASSEKIDPLFTIKTPQKTVTWTRSELLARKDLARLILSHDPIYAGKKMTYFAIPLSALFSSLPISPESTVLFHCMNALPDEPPMSISGEKLLNVQNLKTIAHLAIEKDNEKWPSPLLPTTRLKTPGPFRLIWTSIHTPETSLNEWPIHLSSFEVKPSLREIYPKIFPDHQLSKNNPIYQGFKIFTKNCFSCHTINLQGQSQLGPDLNIPLNPTEYLSIFALKKLIRNPQDLRIWPESKMKSFSETDLSHIELESLINYLRHMKNRKISFK